MVECRKASRNNRNHLPFILTSCLLMIRHVTYSKMPTYVFDDISRGSIYDRYRLLTPWLHLLMDPFIPFPQL